MKLRRIPEDFCVEERNSLLIGAAGVYAVYELRKRGWNTLDALERLARMMKIPRKNFSHAGLKDRHAQTKQTITVRHGPRRDWHDESLSLTYLGQSTRPTGPQDIQANRFQIVLRSLSDSERETAETSLPLLQQYGIPNYFDDQRFGSWIDGKGFIAEAWIRGDYSRALWLTFAEHQPGADAHERAQRAILREHWQDWGTCKKLLSRSHRRSIVTYLCDKPSDFRGAWGIVNAEMRGIMLSAIQSHLWNQIVVAFVSRQCAPEQLSSGLLKPGPVVFPGQLTGPQLELFESTALPLPSARLRLEEEPWGELISQSLLEQGWSIADLKVKFPRDRFFSRSRRAIWTSFVDLAGEFSTDDLQPGLSKLKLSFTLPRGSYATMVVKGLIPQTIPGETTPEEDSLED